MRALVTGGAGFIGSHVVDALLARGDEVHVLDDLSSGRRENVAAAAVFHEGDIRDPDAALAAARPEIVFHLAAQASVIVSVQRPADDADINVLGTVRMLEAAREHGARLVFASTGGAIYGDVPRPVAEDHPRAPVSPYGTAKLAGEEYVLTWNRLHGTQHVIVRYGNVYGPRQDPHGEAGVVAIFLQKVARGEVPTIFGDGSQVRDYVYVRDVARATLAAVDADPDVFNIASGSGSSLLDLVAKMREAVGQPFPVEHGPGRLGELQHIELDVTHAAQKLGWQPETPLEDGLREAWDFFRTQP
ncbi:MAG: NAD-dependent epimerase/dehydratase family protein [Gaiellaceae bacterium]